MKSSEILNKWSERSSSSASSPSNSTNSAIVDVGVFVAKVVIGCGVACAVGSYVLPWLAGQLENLGSDPSMTSAARSALAKRLRRPEIDTMDFDSYEQRLIPDVIGAEEITTGFGDIGGLDDAIDEIKDNVVTPLQIWKYHKSYASTAPYPSGVLLFGPPGTGKSLIAKAIAKEAGVTFISIKASSILNKFVGESERMSSAIFKLARKLAPSIIFIDEIDTLLQKRTNDAHHMVSTIQGIFLAEWDGLTVQRQQELQSQTDFYHGPVIVLGATNRPADLDPAILRRMPVKLAVPVPNKEQRLAIMKAQLRLESVADDVDLTAIVEGMEGKTGADIKEVIRIACLQRTKEMTALAQKLIMESAAKNGASPFTESLTLKQAYGMAPRPLSKEDFAVALSKTTQRESDVKKFHKQEAMSLLDELAKIMPRSG